MRISIEKASDGTFIIEVPCKKRKNKEGELEYKEDLKYTAKTEEDALKVVAEALKEIETPEDEYGIGFNEAAEEPKKG